MKSKTRVPRTKVHTKKNGKCWIPGAIPAEVISEYVLGKDENEAEKIRSYVECQMPKEIVRHLEKISTENIYGQPMNAWDVRTNKNRWWVITNPINLYLQRLFPSLDYTLSFHVGVTTRAAQSEMTDKQEKAHGRVNQLANRLADARDASFKAKNTSDFQAVGMKCRECLLHISQAFAKANMVPNGHEIPQRGNFLCWCELIANHIVPVDSNKQLRSYLKAIEKEAWQLAGWLTQTQSAKQYHGNLVVDATENVLQAYVITSACHKRK